jgi:hypothetical protein
MLSGWMSLSFEDFAIGCRQSEKNKKTLGFITIDFDLPSIQKTSPRFADEVKSDIQKGHQRWGGVKREIVVRARLQFSKEMIEHPDKAEPLSGFGHLGASSGEVVVTEIIKYGPNQVSEPTAASGRGSP